MPIYCSGFLMARVEHSGHQWPPSATSTAFGFAFMGIGAAWPGIMKILITCAIGRSMVLLRYLRKARTGCHRMHGGGPAQGSGIPKVSLKRSQIYIQKLQTLFWPSRRARPGEKLISGFRTSRTEGAGYRLWRVGSAPTLLVGH